MSLPDYEKKHAQKIICLRLLRQVADLEVRVAVLGDGLEAKDLREVVGLARKKLKDMGVV